MRINKFIATNSKYSRRKADELIESGKVFVNDRKVREMGMQIDPDSDKVAVFGVNIKPKDQKTYIALHKPKDYITTRSDDLGRQTVMSLVPEGKNLKPIGRLDKESEGLLLFTNDGDFINKLTHPKFECEKEYFTIIKGELSDENKTLLETGIKIDRKKTAPAKIKIIHKNADTTSLRIIINEGRNRQIRKMFAQVDHPVKYLQRIRIGNIKLSPLRKGKYRNLTTKEINNAY